MIRSELRAVGLCVTHWTGSDQPRLVALDALRDATGLSPAVVAQFVALGLLEPVGGTPERPLFADDAAPRLAAAERLRRDLELDYPGAVLVCELLARIERLEQRLDALGEDARTEPGGGGTDAQL